MATNTDARLDSLKKKYASVLSTMQQGGVLLSHVHVQDDKLFIQGEAPSQEVKNKVWDQIKLVDPSYSDLTADITVSANAAPAASAGAASAPAAQNQNYSVKPGDTLSKIAKQFYGDANAYMKIFEANRNILSDPNKIQVGQSLVIPPK
jgi:nucleoid-associated protein YgaU